MFNEKNTPWSDFAQAALSSSSVPGIFPPQHFQGKILMDGMTGWNTNVEDAIQRCREITTDESKITIDVLTCGYHEVTEFDVSQANSLDNWFRGRAISNFLTGSNAINQSLKAHPKVNLRHYV